MSNNPNLKRIIYNRLLFYGKTIEFKNNKLLNIMLNKMSSEDIINLLFESNILEKNKINISKIINNSKSNSIVLSISATFIKNNYLLDKNLLGLKKIPNCIKLLILKNHYNSKDDIINLLNDNDEYFEIKKFVINEICKNNLSPIVDYYHIYDLIDSLVDKDVINYFCSTFFNKLDKLSFYLKLSNNEELKIKLIKEKINSKNIFEVLSDCILTEEIKEKVYELRFNEFCNGLESIKTNDLIDYIKSNNFYTKASDYILDKKINKIKKNLFFKSTIFNEYLFFSSANEKILNMMYDYHKVRLPLYLLLFHLYNPVYDPLKWLGSKDVPIAYKKLIYYTNPLSLKLSIKQMNLFEINTFISNYSSEEFYQKITNKILLKKKKYIINKFRNADINEFVFSLNKISNNKDYLQIICDYCINENNIFEILASPISLDLKKRILELNKNNARITMIDNISNNIFNFKISNLGDEELNLVVLVYYKEILERLNAYDNKILISKLSHKDILENIKRLILIKLGYKLEDINNIIYFIKKMDADIVLNHYDKIINFFKLSNINFDAFLQYGVGSSEYNNWLDEIIYIIDNNKQDKFLRAKDYLFLNYYSNKENNVYSIKNFLEIISNYIRCESLFDNMILENIVLNENDKSNIKYLLIQMKISAPKKYEELNFFRDGLYSYTLDRIKNSNNISDIKSLLNIIMFPNDYNLLNSLGGISSLKLLKYNNKNSNTISILIDELIKYNKIIDLIDSYNDIEELKIVLLKLFSTKEEFISFQNLFMCLNDKVKRLYEIESQVNLTKIDSIKYKEKVLNIEFMKKYGGEVYDFSDKNYILYAHVKSPNENIDDIINGNSSSINNFISMTPISYKGQVYYYNINECIFLYDTIRNGSFICSSLKNMGSNYSLKESSYEFNNMPYEQRGILETSSNVNENSETLLYREGLKPCAIALPGGRTPTKIELEYHNKYNLPFVITQKENTTIENPNFIFSINDDYNISVDTNKLDQILAKLESMPSYNKFSKEYTGRRVAIFADSHALYTPTLEILEDIKKKGIREIYSLGDNIGSGPNPCEVIDLLDEYNVKSVAGNSEYYVTLGTNVFEYLTFDRIENEEWTYDKLGQSRIDRIKSYGPSIDLIIGDKRVALCHFSNDVRWDFNGDNNTWNYQDIIKIGKEPIQFDYTNSAEAKKVIEEQSKLCGKGYDTYRSAMKYPIFDGKKVSSYTNIIQGHVHFESNTKLRDTNISTLRGAAIGYASNPERDKACYYILKERNDGNFDIEKVLLSYNKNYLISDIKSSSLPHKEKILSYLR